MGDRQALRGREGQRRQLEPEACPDAIAGPLWYCEGDPETAKPDRICNAHGEREVDATVQPPSEEARSEREKELLEGLADLYGVSQPDYCSPSVGRVACSSSHSQVPKAALIRPSVLFSDMEFATKDWVGGIEARVEQLASSISQQISQQISQMWTKLSSLDMRLEDALTALTSQSKKIELLETARTQGQDLIGKLQADWASYQNKCDKCANDVGFIKRQLTSLRTGLHELEAKFREFSTQPNDQASAPEVSPIADVRGRLSSEASQATAMDKPAATESVGATIQQLGEGSVPGPKANVFLEAETVSQEQASLTVQPESGQELVAAGRSHAETTSPAAFEGFPVPARPRDERSRDLTLRAEQALWAAKNLEVFERRKLLKHLPVSARLHPDKGGTDAAMKWLRTWLGEHLDWYFEPEEVPEDLRRQYRE